MCVILMLGNNAATQKKKVLSAKRAGQNYTTKKDLEKRNYQPLVRFPFVVDENVD